MNLITCILGLLVVLYSYYSVCAEAATRTEENKRKIGTKLIFHGCIDDNGRMVDREYDISTNRVVMGKRRRKCDVNLSCFKDERISRIHCILRMDRENYWVLYPCFRTTSKKDIKFIQNCNINGLSPQDLQMENGYTKVYLNREVRPIPSGGIRLRDGDRFFIYGHEISIHRTRPAYGNV